MKVAALLAAGKGTRFYSKKSKMLHELCDEALITYSYQTLIAFCDKVFIVLGHQAQEIQAVIKSLKVYSAENTVFVHQEEQLGTGHALKCVLQSPEMQSISQAQFYVCNGDMPLIDQELLSSFEKSCQKHSIANACMSFESSEPFGLGRIIRDSKGVFNSIVEEKDCTADQKAITEVNGGLYFFELEYLKKSLDQLKNNNAQGEFYITDLLGMQASKQGSLACVGSQEKLLGCNNLWELQKIEEKMQSALIKKWSLAGVRFLNPQSVVLSYKTTFEGEATIGPNVRFVGECSIAEQVLIDGDSYIEKSKIACGSHIAWGTVIEDSVIGERNKIGPSAHLRPGNILGKDVKIGNFVELKKAKLGDGSKASHLSYLGDAEIGSQTNIGCGTITCNYDGVNKWKTEIGDRVFVGSDSQLVAPVKIESDSYIASGTTLTKNVPSGALAIARSECKIKEGYADKLKKRFLAKKQ